MPGGRELPWWVPVPAFAAGLLAGYAGSRCLPSLLGKTTVAQDGTSGVSTPPLTPGASAPRSPPASISGVSVSSYLPPTPRGPGLVRVASGSGERFKMAVVLRADLGWSSQMVATMSAGVVLALFKKLFKLRDPVLNIWEAQRGWKVVLVAQDEAQLAAVVAAAKEAEVATHAMVANALSRSNSTSQGHSSTSTGGSTADASSSAGSEAVLAGKSKIVAAIGPAPAEVIDSLTSRLHIL